MSLLLFFTGQCPALEPIPNGTITFAPDMMTDYDVGTVATYSCDFGFILVGSEAQLCIGGGIWSGQPPECQRKIRYKVFTGSGKVKKILVQKLS